jgi:hypothetical protein
MVARWILVKKKNANHQSSIWNSLDLGCVHLKAACKTKTRIALDQDKFSEFYLKSLSKFMNMKQCYQSFSSGRSNESKAQ